MHAVPGSWTANRDIQLLSVWVWGLQFQIVNVYNAPPTSNNPGQGVKSLLNWIPPALPLLLAGDLNLKHSAWQPGVTPNQQAEPFQQWTVDAEFALTMEPGTPTQGPNMLDHAWATKQLVQLGVNTQVADQLYTSSDHRSLLTKVCLPGHTRLEQLSYRFQLDTMDKRLFRQTLEAHAPQLNRLSKLSDPPSPEQLDTLAKSITNILAAALEASTRKTSGQGTGQPWWNEDCRKAIAALHRTQRWDCSLERDARCNLHRAIQKAKQEYWQGQIAGASEGKDIFRMVKWAHSAGSFYSPALQDEAAGVVRIEPREKRDLLQQVLLQKAACQEDVPTSWPNNFPERLPFPEPTAHEIQNSLLNTGNTTPGTDKVSTEVLCKAWQYIQIPVERLYSACLKIGWHPTSFRDATLVVLPKPNRNPAIPRSYRLIALLSTLGKGLERLVARRLAWIAIHEKLVHPQQFGALPGRAASDLVAAVVHDIEESWA